MSGHKIAIDLQNFHKNAKGMCECETLGSGSAVSQACSAVLHAAPLTSAVLQISGKISPAACTDQDAGPGAGGQSLAAGPNLSMNARWNYLESFLRASFLACYVILVTVFLLQILLSVPGLTHHQSSSVSSGRKMNDSESDTGSLDGVLHLSQEAGLAPGFQPPSPVSREQLHKRIESLQQQNRVLNMELDTYKLRVKSLQVNH